MRSFVRAHARLLAAVVGLPLILANLAVPGAAPSTAGRPADPAAVDAWLEAQVRDAGIPGAAMVIVRDGRIVDERGFGTADDTGRAVTATTPFMIGSLSKSITAMAVMQLVDAGRVALDAPVRRYVPGFAVADEMDSDRITIRELLDHTSGLPTSAGVAPLSQPVTTLDRRVGDLATVGLVSEPGSRYVYSNANYLVLGRLVETVSGQSFGDYVQAHIFTPLEMTHASTDRATAIANGLTQAHRLWFGLAPTRAPLDRPDLVPAGFIAASADDLGRFLIAQLDGGRYAGQAVVSSAAVEAMHAGTVPTGLADERSGMGWVTSTLDGEPILAHAGSTTDMAAIQVLIPGRNLGVAILFNAQSPLYELLHKPDAIGLGAAALLMGREPMGTLQAFYPAFDLLIVALFALLVVGLVKVVRRPMDGSLDWAGRSRAGRARLVGSRLFLGYLDVMVPVILLLKVPDVLGAPWPVLVRVDLGAVALGLIVMRLLDGGIRAARFALARRRRDAADVPLSVSGAAVGA